MAKEDHQAILSDLARAKAVFQQRAIAAAIAGTGTYLTTFVDGRMIIEPVEIIAVPEGVSIRPGRTQPAEVSPASTPPRQAANHSGEKHDRT